MADTTVVLGGFAFGGFEVPEHIPFGGKQRLAVHRLVGADPVVDAMGPDNGPLSWSGLFRGGNALPRARTLDAMREAGAQHQLAWGGLFFTVVIQEFWADYKRFYDVPYRITCFVLSSGGGGALPVRATLDELVRSDLVPALAASAQGIMPDGVVAAMDGLGATLAGAGILEGAPAAGLAPALLAAGSTLTAIRQAVDDQDAVFLTTEEVDESVLPAAGFAASALAALAATQTQSRLFDLGALVGRIGTNLSDASGP